MQNPSPAHDPCQRHRRSPPAGIDQRWGPAPAGTRIEPDAVAETYAMLAEQHPTAWTHELDIRPSVEKW
jgi:hypothetical protein